LRAYLLTFLYPLFSLIISLITVKLIKDKFSHVLQDIPNDRSSHTQPTPRGGGLGFIIAFALTSLPYAFQNHSLPELGWWWLILAPLAIIGICDDRWSIPSTWRYLVQLLTATIATLHFHPFPQPWLASLGTPGNILAILFTIIGMTAIVNFYNFMDGLDGLVGGVTTVQIAFLAYYTSQPLLWLLAAALLGFLYWNWSPAKIFMGDAGSTFLGAIMAIALLNQPPDPISSWTSLAILLPLIADAIYTLTRRLLKKENIFQAHRSHIYQRLQQSGLSHGFVAGLYTAFTMLVAFFIYEWQSWGAIGSTILLLLLMVSSELYVQQKSPVLQ
jgi:Fuc2NAc and GlcNAc transferase